MTRFFRTALVAASSALMLLLASPAHAADAANSTGSGSAATVHAADANVNSTETQSTSGVILVRGNKMYNSQSGARFFIKGMTYEYAVDDEHYTKYSKDVIATQLAGVDMNTLRLYDINPDLSYKKFMTDMAARGVYVIVGGTPDNSDYYTKYRYATLKKSFGPNDGETCYSPVLLEFGKKIARNFAQFDNTLAILIGNEVMQKDLTAAACVKQYTADLKTWMRVNAKKMRTLPLAYAAADSAYGGKIASAEEYHTLKIQGLLCGDKMQDGVMTRSIDIYLINEYRWCPGRDFAVYQQFQAMAQGLPIVIGFGEYGCKLNTERDWKMVPYFYDEPAKTQDFSAVFSGGLAYSFGEAKLPSGSLFPMFSGGSMDPMGQPSSKPSGDFKNLKQMFADHKPYSDAAKWESNAKCKWAPEITAKISASNTRATTSGWIVADCTASVLKVVDGDTWVTKSRQGQDCEAGTDCDAPVTDKVGTTQEDICGKAAANTTATETGGACSASSDCQNGGSCVEVDKVKQCKCAACFTGSNCGFKDESTCPSNSTSDATTAPASAATPLSSVAMAATVLSAVVVALAL